DRPGADPVRNPPGTARTGAARVPPGASRRSLARTRPGTATPAAGATERQAAPLDRNRCRSFPGPRLVRPRRPEGGLAKAAGVLPPDPGAGHEPWPRLFQGGDRAEDEGGAAVPGPLP